MQAIEDNWRGGKHNLQRINCRSENSKGVYCLQYDDTKIVSGLRDNTIKMWDRQVSNMFRLCRNTRGTFKPSATLEKCIATLFFRRCSSTRESSLATLVQSSASNMMRR